MLPKIGITAWVGRVMSRIGSYTLSEPIRAAALILAAVAEPSREA